MILYVLLAILMLGVLIAIHEFGHFISARLCGIAVKEFSIGFGPLLFQRVSKKTEMKFSLRAIPLGGYCMFYGDTDDDPEGLGKDDPRCYNKAPVWKRLLSVFSGPAMNMILAFIVAVILMAGYGIVYTSPLIYEVVPDRPAAAAGLQAGDVFVSVNGQPMQDCSTSEVSEAIGATAEGEPVQLVMRRDGEELSFELLPQYSEEDGRYLIGITITPGYEHMPAGQIVPAAFETCVDASGAILGALGKMVTTGEGFDQTTGPIGVVQTVAEYTQQYGFQQYLYLAVIISINLGLVNLLPIPGLDGSRIVFMLIEAVRRKPVKQKTEAIIHMCGYALLFGLMIFFTFRDVVRLFQ